MKTTDAEKKVDDVNTDTGNNGENGTDDHSTSVNKEGSVPLATFLEMKKTAKQLEVDINTMKANLKTEADAKLKEDGKLNELITAKEQELLLKQTELENYKVKADEMEQFKTSKIDAAKLKLGTKWNDEYSKLSLLALDALVNSIITSSKDLSLDKGATGEHASIELTADQKRDAYAKYPHISKEKAEEYHKHNLIKVGIIKEK